MDRIDVSVRKSPHFTISRSVVLFVALVLLAQCVGCNGDGDGHEMLPASPSAGPSSVETLMERVLLAIKQEDRDDLLGLYYWEGVDEDFRAKQCDMACRWFLGLQVGEAYIEEAPVGDTPCTFDGQPLVYTLPPTRQITLKEVQTDPRVEMTFYLGAAEVDGVWYLVAARRRRPNEVPQVAVIEEYKGPAANPRPGNGREKYEAVKIGMSRDEVFAILGNVMVHKEQETEDSQVIYEWPFRGGSISVGFTDGIAGWKGNTFVNK